MAKDSSLFQPDYRSLLEYIRNQGIKPEDCLRDIADNGYDAGSDRINILFIEKANRSKMAKELREIQIIDWGRGMNELETIASLVPASTGRVRNQSYDLGKFGIGLLASSLNICDRVEIVTRSAEGAYYTYLDYNEKQSAGANEINLVRKATIREIETLDKVLGLGHTGTIVTLKHITRLPQSKETVPNLISRTEFLFAKGYYHLRDKFKVYIGNENSTKLVAPYDPLERNACLDKSPVLKFHVKKDKDGNPIDEYITVQMSFINTYRGYSDRPYKKHSKPQLPSAGFSVVRNGRELCWNQSFGLFTNTGLLNNFRAEIVFTGEHLDGHIFTVNSQKTESHIINKAVYQEIAKHVKEYIEKVVEPTRSGIAENNKQVRNSSPKVKVESKPTVHPVLEALRSLDLENLTMKQGFDLLASLKEQAM